MSGPGPWHDDADWRMSRRRALGTLGALGIAGIWGCNGSDSDNGGTDSSSGSGTSGSDSDSGSSGSGSTGGGTSSGCVVVARETDGPYPLYAILANDAMVRSDIREDRTGVPLTLTLTLENVNNNCAPIVSAAVYIWHCDRAGSYSGYSSSQNGGNYAGQTWLRGIQVSDSNGQVTFTTIYPGWYTGRITHIHVQIYLNDNLSVTATATTQLAFPQDTTTAVYNSTLYRSHGQNSSVTSFSADNVFSDGTSTQMLTLTGDTSNGYTGNITLGIAVPA